LVKSLLDHIIIGFRESFMKWISSNFFTVEKSSKKALLVFRFDVLW